MGFQLVEYKALEQNIQESIITELKSHRLNPRTVMKSIEALSVKHPERAIQCQYLLTVCDCLNKAAVLDENNEYDEERKMVLNAAAYYIHEQIDDSYKGSVTPYFLVPQNSTLFNSLTTSLNLMKGNRPDTRQKRDMYIALERFMKEHVYNDSDSGKGYLEDKEHVFSQEKIKGYKVEKDLTDLVQKIAALEAKQIGKTFKLFKSQKLVPKEVNPIADQAIVCNS